MKNPTIVIPAFARPASLERLLLSLNAASYDHDVHLVLSIDQTHAPDMLAANETVKELAAEFEWQHGTKQVINHAQPLGLTGNALYCGKLTAEFGSVLVLEDDLFVSKAFYTYACAALDAYGQDNRLAGISLNSPWFNGLMRQPFIPLLDGSDTFFLQLSTPHGQVYTENQWRSYEIWLSQRPPQSAAVNLLHSSLTSLPDSDWLKTKDHYLADQHKFYVYPRESFTVNFGEAGFHFDQATSYFQVPLQDYSRPWNLGGLDEALAVYDAFYEISADRLRRFCPHLPAGSFDVDMYGSKDPQHWRSSLVLTTRPCRRSIQSFGRILVPLEANVINGIPGQGIVLAERPNIRLGTLASLATRKRNNDFFGRVGY